MTLQQPVTDPNAIWSDGPWPMKTLNAPGGKEGCWCHLGIQFFQWASHCKEQQLLGQHQQPQCQELKGQQPPCQQLKGQDQQALCHQLNQLQRKKPLTQPTEREPMTTCRVLVIQIQLSQPGVEQAKLYHWVGVLALDLVGGHLTLLLVGHMTLLVAHGSHLVPHCCTGGAVAVLVVSCSLGLGAGAEMYYFSNAMPQMAEILSVSCKKEKMNMPQRQNDFGEVGYK